MLNRTSDWHSFRNLQEAEQAQLEVGKNMAFWIEEGISMRGKFGFLTTLLGLMLGGAIAFGELPKVQAQTVVSPAVVGTAQVNVTPVQWWGGGYRWGYYRPYWYGPRYYSYYRPYYSPYYYSWYPRYYSSYYYPGAYLSYSYPGHSYPVYRGRYFW